MGNDQGFTALEDFRSKAERTDDGGFLLRPEPGGRKPGGPGDEVRYLQGAVEVTAMYDPGSNSVGYEVHLHRPDGKIPVGRGGGEVRYKPTVRLKAAPEDRLSGSLQFHQVSSGVTLAMDYDFTDSQGIHKGTVTLA